MSGPPDFRCMEVQSLPGEKKCGWYQWEMRNAQWWEFTVSTVVGVFAAD